MAFVNEYISDDDMEKYKVKDVWKAFYPNWGPKNDILMQRYAWTIDRDRNIFFVPVMSGRFEESNQKTCALWWDGVLISVTIADVGGGFDYETRTGAVLWDLIRIWKPKGCDVTDEQIIPVLKEALMVYQYRGIRTPMKSYPVTFTF